MTVIEVGPRLLTRAVPAPMAELIKTKHERSGVRIETGAIVERIDALEGQSKVVLSDGRTHLADLVVVGIGAVPNVEVAQVAGLAVHNGIAVDEMLATSDPYIFAAGDCCSFPHRLYGERIRLEAWRNAQRQGAAAASNMLGANRPYGGRAVVLVVSIRRYAPNCWPLSRGALFRHQESRCKGQLVFYLAPDGCLVGTCGFGSLGAIAKEIRFAEMMIARRLAPRTEALADSAVNIKCLLA